MCQTGGNEKETFVLRTDGTLRVDIPNNIDSRVTSLYTLVVQASDGRYVGYTTCKIYVAPNPGKSHDHSGDRFTK